MTRDKQLFNVDLSQMLEKRRLDQALNAKEFAVLAGISYSAARAWFKQPGFPAFSGVVFWQDFVEWRKAKAGLSSVGESPARTVNARQPDTNGSVPKYTGKVAKLMALVG